MLEFNLQPTGLTPLVAFDQDTCELKIEGRMIPEDVEAAFHPIKKWMETYLALGGKLHILFRLYFYNTSSARQFFLLFKRLNEHHLSGKTISIRWEYEDGDEDSRADAEEFLKGAGFPYEIISVTN